MVTVTQILNFAISNRDAFREIITITREKDPLLDILDEQSSEIKFLRNQISSLRTRLNTNI
jgi:predicted acetyltransferase